MHVVRNCLRSSAGWCLTFSGHLYYLGGDDTQVQQALEESDAKNRAEGFLVTG